MKQQSTFSRDHWRSDGSDQEPSGLEQYYCYSTAMYSIWLLPEQLLYSAPQASHFLSWGCVDIDLPQVHDSPFIIPSFYPAGVKNGHTPFSA